MKKFLIGFAAGILLVALTVFVLLLALLRLGERPPSISDGSTLVVELGGAIPEQPALSFPFPLPGARAPMTVHEVWDLLRIAAADPRIEAVAFFPRGVSTGWGRLREIHDCLHKFTESGKPLVAFLRHPGGQDYYLATAADHIYMLREDLLNVKGLRAELIFLRQTMDKLGIELEVEHAGRYKDAADMFTRTSMSPETREVMDSVLDLLYGDFVETVAKGRGLEAGQIRAALDEGPFLSTQAVEKGLVDELLFEDEMFERLRKRLGQEKIRKLPHRTYMKVPAAVVGLDGGSRVALVVGEGSIMGGGGQDGLWEEGVLRSRSFIRLLRKVGNDSQIKGVILRINSPGGDAIASDEILREVRLLRDKKPLVISMSDMAASGGYFIAMTGDPIVAYPNTFTGSIGVIYGKLNLRGLYDKLGIRKQYLTRGRFADIDSDYKPLSEPARAKLREGIDAVYDSFLDRVVEGRNRDIEEIRPLAEGRVWLGSQARDNGLIDELGGLDRAIELVKERAGIPPDEEIRLVPYPPKRSVFQYLFEQFEQSEQSAIASELRGLLNGLDVRLLMEGGILKLMPYTIDVR